MKTLKQQDLQDDPTQYSALARSLERGGLVCVPCRGSYRILANLNDKGAVQSLIQSKRRTKNAPSLVFISDADQLAQVTGQVCARAQALSRRFWPGPLTILFSAHPDMPSKIAKELTRSTGKIGVRVPAEDTVQNILRAFGGPVLVSSANRSKKHGESSPAQVQKNFLGRVDFFVDAGDLTPDPHSTVVDLEGPEVQITREGVLTRAQINAAL